MVCCTGWQKIKGKGVAQIWPDVPHDCFFFQYWLHNGVGQSYWYWRHCCWHWLQLCCCQHPNCGHVQVSLHVFFAISLHFFYVPLYSKLYLKVSMMNVNCTVWYMRLPFEVAATTIVQYLNITRHSSPQVVWIPKHWLWPCCHCCWCCCWPHTLNFTVSFHSLHFSYVPGLFIYCVMTNINCIKTIMKVIHYEEIAFSGGSNNSQPSNVNAQVDRLRHNIAHLSLTCSCCVWIISLFWWLVFWLPCIFSPYQHHSTI